LQIDYIADGAPECPLIRIWDFTRQEACDLKQIFAALASRRKASHTIGKSPIQLQLVIGTQNKLIPAETPNAYVWTLSHDEWRTVTELTAPFCESDVHGFQWLKEDGIAILLSVNGKW
jgi:hypothetical protein